MRGSWFQTSWLLPVVLLWTGCKDSDFDGVRDKKDCAPEDARISPDAKEVCDGVDNDCNGQVDEGVTIEAYLDRDQDGAGDPAFVRRVCEMPDNGVAVGGDCDDFDSEAHPAGVEVCDEKDNNCDGGIDEGVTTTYYVDDDGDGHGVASGAVEGCQPGPGRSTLSDDCDDTEPAAWDDAREACDGIDNDCDGDTDETLAPVRLWTDADGDGFGDPNSPVVGCGPIDGVVDNDLDCDDGDAATSPDTIESRGNARDEDCDGYVDEFGVGPGNEFATVFDALRSAPDGAVVQLDSGLHLANVSLVGRDVTLAGEGCDRTTLYADADGSVVTMDAGRLTGLTVSGGGGTPFGTIGNVGGGVFVRGDVTIEGACIVGNSARKGGGVAVVEGSLTMIDSLVADNTSDLTGAGIWGVVPAVEVNVTGSRLVGNRTLQYGGGIGTEGIHTIVTNSVIAGNQCSNRGCGAYIDEERDSTSTLIGGVGEFYHVTFHGNHSDPTVAGAHYGEAILSLGSTVVAADSLFTGHTEPWDLFESQTGGGPGGTIDVTTSGYRGNAAEDKDLQTFFLNRIAGEPRYVNVDPDLPPTEWDLHLRDDSDFRDGGDVLEQDPDGSVADLGAYGGPDAPAGWDFGFVIDDDADGMLSGREIGAGTNRWVDDASDDPDQDGASNEEELAVGSDPLAVDTDDDGVEDGVELGLSTDPLDPRDHAPMADAGPLVRLGLTAHAVAVSAADSFDADGDRLSYAWTVLSGPPTSIATLTATTVDADFTPDVPGTYVLRVTVDDGTTTRSADTELRARDGFLVPDDVPTLAEALNTVVDGEMIGLAPGVYAGGLDLSGRDLAIVGLGDSPEDTILEGWGQGATLTQVGGALALARVTVQGGRSVTGGGIHADGAASVGLHEVVLRDNHAIDGAGAWLNASPALLTDVVLERNVASGTGGGLAINGEDLHETLIVRRGRFEANKAPEGAGVWFSGGTVDDGNDADGWLEDVSFVGNTGDTGVALRHNGVGSDLRVEHATFVANTGTTLVQAINARQVLLSTVMRDNVVDELLGGSSSATTQALDGVWSEVPPDPFGLNADELDLWQTWLEVPTELGAFVDDGDPSTDLLVGAIGSPVLDAGFIERTDRDGSRADAGSCAGKYERAGCVSFRLDLDGDGLPDGWERAFGTDPATGDGNADPDADGLTNRQELAAGTLPGRADSDADGVDDGVDATPWSDLDHRPRAVVADEQVADAGVAATLDGSASFDPDGGPVTFQWRLISAPAGSTATPTNTTSAAATLVPDTTGAYRLGLTVTDGSGAASREAQLWVIVPVIREVPADYATVADAYAAALPGDTIRLAAGAWPAELDLTTKPISLVGAGADRTELVGISSQPVAYTHGPRLVLRDLAVTGGANQSGGGVRCDGAELSLERVDVRDNVAYSGAGLYLFDCDATLTDTNVLRNHSAYNGAGIYADAGSLVFHRGNVAFNSSDGAAGGMLLMSVDAELSNLVFHRNLSDGSGAAMMVQFQAQKDYGGVSVDHCTFSGNKGAQGAVHRLDDQPLTLTNSLFVDNKGYGLYDTDVAHTGLDAHDNLWWKNNTHSSPSSLSGGATDQRNVDPKLVAYDPTKARLVDPELEDLRLRENSPAKDAASGTFDPDGSPGDRGAFGGPNALPGWDVYFVDSDSDGMADEWESEHGLDPGTPDGFVDVDGDGMSARAEFPFTDPNAADTDGDGFDDDVELGSGGDPADALDQAPNPDAGPDGFGSVGIAFSRTAAGTDPQNDPISYTWTLLEVPGRSAVTAGDLTGTTTATVGFVPDVPGMYVLGVAASDAAGTSPVERFEVRIPGEVRVPADYPTVQRAVYAAADASTVRIAAGTWPTRVDLDGNSLSFVGAGRDQTFLDGERRGRVVQATRAEAVSFTGLTLERGNGGRGGAVYVDGGSVTLTDVALLDHRAGEGGALFVYDGSADGVGVVAADNFAGFRGGAVMGTQNSALAFDQSIFAHNQALEDQGGAIRAYTTTLDLTNVILTENVAEEGGAVYAYGSSAIVNFDHVTATFNDGLDYGAVLRFTSSADATVASSLFAYNSGHSVVSDTSSAGQYVQHHTLVDENTTVYTFNLTSSGVPLDGLDANEIDNNYTIGFSSVTDDGDWTNDDWTLLPASDARNAGDPVGGLDPDGSPADMGAHGGPGGDF